MTEERLQKIEKQINGGIVRFMLKMGMKEVAIAGIGFVIVRLLNFFDYNIWAPTKPAELVIFLIVFFVGGCWTCFSKWDRMVEVRNKHLAEKIGVM